MNIKPIEIVLPPGTIVPGWKLLQPLLVVILPEDNGGYLAYDRFNVYGYGATQEKAQQDYITALIEYYQVLVDKTDPPTRALFQRLQSYLQREPESTGNIWERWLEELQKNNNTV